MISLKIDSSRRFCKELRGIKFQDLQLGFSLCMFDIFDEFICCSTLAYSAG